MHRVGDLAVFDPKAAGPARIIAGDVIHALPHEFDHKQARAQLAQHGVEVVACAGLAGGEGQVVRATCVTSGAHAEFAGRITAQHIALYAAIAHDVPLLRAHTLFVKRRTAFAHGHVGVLVDADVLGKDLLAQ